MRQRAFIHVDGPPGAGKTTLVEQLLTHTDHMITVARGIRDDTVDQARESLAETDLELRRYRAAGAHTAARWSGIAAGQSPWPQPGTVRPAAEQRLCWAVADTYRGIERAQFVVVDVRDHTGSDQGEALLAEVARLRTDDTVFTDVIGRRGNRIPVTAVVADLTQPTAPGTKKALARIRRAIRQHS